MIAHCYNGIRFRGKNLHSHIYELDVHKLCVHKHVKHDISVRMPLYTFPCSI
jgi:hypothetical protein